MRLTIELTAEQLAEIGATPGNVGQHIGDCLTDVADGYFRYDWLLRELGAAFQNVVTMERDDPQPVAGDRDAYQTKLVFSMPPDHDPYVMHAELGEAVEARGGTVHRLVTQRIRKATY